MTDEMDRPIYMQSWPTSGNPTNVWAIDESAWGVDANLIGPAVYQPLLFKGQYLDAETVAVRDDGTTAHRSPLAYNRFREYDPWVGAYLQVDPLVAETWSSYGYVDGNAVANSDRLGLSPKNCGDLKPCDGSEGTWSMDGGGPGCNATGCWGGSDDWWDDWNVPWDDGDGDGGGGGGGGGLGLFGAGWFHLLEFDSEFLCDQCMKNCMGFHDSHEYDIPDTEICEPYLDPSNPFLLSLNCHARSDEDLRSQHTYECLGECPDCAHSLR